MRAPVTRSSALLRSFLARRARAPFEMPNIKQQKKRVRIASRERLETLRYRSTVKTLTRRVREAVEAGDPAVVAERKQALEHWLDLAAARGAIHKNKAARKKSQLARATAAVATAAPAAPAAAQPAEAAPAKGRGRGRRGSR
jgi:small subunit ribosomal protein S20